ncbi:restriction endonuclease [Paenibacillus koleovorans]|uniref:restriction endonuclease n=1 Tax=Paenibacillus koleovorans TaxID=121608 RepID=UPI000FDCA633|nr:restriction endonuclease [Paenibacillus koleovorans]
MARTHYAEGRQLAKMVQGTLLLIGLGLFFLTGLNKIWWLFFVILFVSVITGEIIGAMWTQRLRRNKGQSSQSKAATKTKSAKAAVQSTSSHKKLSDAEVKNANVDSLSGTDFERLMEMYYKDQGYQVQRVGGSGDHEVDLILKGKEGYKIAVQCKRWKQDVGNDIVLRLKAGKQVHGCYDAWIVTTSNFTVAAKEAADKLNIKLINGLILNDKLKKWKTKNP